MHKASVTAEQQYFSGRLKPGGCSSAQRAAVSSLTVKADPYFHQLHLSFRASQQVSPLYVYTHTHTVRFWAVREAVRCYLTGVVANTLGHTPFR